MKNFKQTVNVKNRVIGGTEYTRFVKILPENAKDLEAQLKEALATGEPGISIGIGNIDSIAKIAASLKEFEETLKDRIVILDLNTEGYDAEFSVEEKLNAARTAAPYIDVFGGSLNWKDEEIASLKEAAKKYEKKVLLSDIRFEGIRSKDELVSLAKAAEGKGANMVYLACVTKDDPDVITLGYASKEIAASDIVSIPACVFPLGEVGFQARILSAQAGNDFGFYHLKEDEEGCLYESYSQYRRILACYESYEKLESNIQYSIDGHVMGGKRFIRCMMIKQRTKDDVIAAAKDVARYNPEMVEWRIDYLLPMGTSKFVENYWIETLKEIKEILPKVPILLTFRVKKEGGLKWYPNKIRLHLTKALINTGLIAYADTEIDNDAEYIKEMQDVCAANGTKLVVSQHNWTMTPSNEEIKDTFRECLEKGSALPKFYLTATNYEDAVRTSEVSKEMRETFLNEPCIICAMGDTGLITRTMGGEIGSDFEFIDVTGIRGGEEEDIHYVDQLADIFGYKEESARLPEKQSEKQLSESRQPEDDAA